MIGLHKNSLSSKTLLTLGKLLEARNQETLPQETLLTALENRLKKETPRWRIRRTVRRMEDSGYIASVDLQGKPGLELTDRGEIELLRHRIMEGSQEWDGKWRVMLFDIPEERRRHRDFLRRKLQWIGFIELHRSIWIIPYDVRDELDELFSLLGVTIKGDIRFMVVERLEHDNDLRSHFDLSERDER